MGTRSTIGIENSDKTVTAIYCHWDGYPSHHAPILQGYYNSTERAEELIALGSLSSLGADIGFKRDFDDRTPGMCRAYGRDRGESGTEPSIYSSIDTIDRQQYNYVWRGNAWYMAKGDEDVWTPLADWQPDSDDA